MARMDVNPYESPLETGYSPPRRHSNWWDFVACVAVALLIHAVIQAAVQAYRILGLDWVSPFANWYGFIRVTYMAVLALYVVFIVAGLVIMRWGRANRT